MNTEMLKCGEWTPEEPITPEEEDICLKMKSDIEKKAGVTFKAYIPLSFRTQLVSGTNHLVKVYVGVGVCVHAMIYEALPCSGRKMTVTGVQHPKIACEPLIPFGH
ncbi:hypothetical protein ABG768_023390 [Culter alburnus]|uniref:Cystatin n=1 Tax=Culter alburnus TaxID=194366 RepID=A0AAW2AQS0_CULAL